MIKHTIIKRVNATEVGQTGTHDTYLLLLSGVQVWNNIFPLTGTFSVIDKRNGTAFRLSFTQPRGENRINRMGAFYRSHGITSGDIVIFEIYETVNGKVYYIDFRSNSSKITLKSSQNKFELYSSDETLLDRLIDLGTYSDYTFTAAPSFSRRSRTIRAINIAKNNQNLAPDVKNLLEIDCDFQTRTFSLKYVTIFNYSKIEIHNENGDSQ